jgi:hypothetical protein
MEFINLSNLTLYPLVDNIPKLIKFVVIAIGVESWTRRRASFGANLGPKLNKPVDESIND